MDIVTQKYVETKSSLLPVWEVFKINVFLALSKQGAYVDSYLFKFSPIFFKL